METCFSEVLFWGVVLGIIGWMIKLLALKIWNKKLRADLRGQVTEISARGGRSFPSSKNESQENDEKHLRKEPGENDERESLKEPQENDERFS